MKCGGIIYDPTGEKVLVILNKNSVYHNHNIWGFPKGHRKPNESNIQCASREILEETGLAFDLEKREERHHINGNIYFKIHLTKSEWKQMVLNPRDTQEVADLKFMRPSEIAQLNLNRDLRKFLYQGGYLSNIHVGRVVKKRWKHAYSSSPVSRYARPSCRTMDVAALLHCAA